MFLETKEIIDDGLEIQCVGIDKYIFDKQVSMVDATAQAIKIAEEFHISELKTDFMAEIFFEEKWSVRKIRDALKYVIKRNIYNTSKSGIEPGKILSFNKQIKFYSQEQVMQINEGSGTGGFVLINIPGWYRYSSYGEIDNWWIRETDLDEFDEIKDSLVNYVSEQAE